MKMALGRRGGVGPGLPLAALVALVAAMAALLLAYNASPARAADGSCSTTRGTTTCTFASTGSEQTFVVPPGVSTVSVVAIGAPGSLGDFGDTAGRGARVSGDLTGLVAGQKLYVNVGGAATGDRDEIGGFNGGGSSGHYGGGGGGASDVRTVSRSGDPLESLESRRIVAGGGGGSGTNLGCTLPDGSTEFLAGGAGGNAGSDGGDGDPCGALAGGTGGKAGTQSEGGAGGSPEGEQGSLGQGGGAVLFGGGGGGGYYGGGGGGDMTSEGSSNAAAGGGGGGSNLVPAGGSAIITTGVPSITISYTDPTADTTPPVVRVPDPITNEATSPDGAVVTFNATAEDAKDGSVEVSCTPPSGSTFPIGTTPVSCSATDAAGNTSTETFSVTVRDNTAPRITVPPNITVEATGPNGAVVQYGTNQSNSCSATDIADRSPTISYSGTPSGSTFPIGTTTLTCTATDSSGNSSTAIFSVTVQDTTAPSVSCSVSPNTLRLPANNHKLVTITASVSVTDGGSGADGFTLVSVTSDQRDSGLARDDVPNDIQGWTINTNDTTGQLRAERYGGARTYKLTYRGKDKAGNTANCQKTVTVPKGG